MGRRPVGIQPTDSTWPGISAGLLGPHRIRLRPRLDSAEALAWDSRSHPGTVGDFSRYVGIGVHSHPYQGMDEGPWGGSQILAPSRSSPRQLNRSSRKNQTKFCDKSLIYWTAGPILLCGNVPM